MMIRGSRRASRMDRRVARLADREGFPLPGGHHLHPSGLFPLPRPPEVFQRPYMVDLHLLL